MSGNTASQVLVWILAIGALVVASVALAKVLQRPPSPTGPTGGVGPTGGLPGPTGGGPGPIINQNPWQEIIMTSNKTLRLTPTPIPSAPIGTDYFIADATKKDRAKMHFWMKCHVAGDYVIGGRVLIGGLPVGTEDIVGVRFISNASDQTNIELPNRFIDQLCIDGTQCAVGTSQVYNASRRHETTIVVIGIPGLLGSFSSGDWVLFTVSANTSDNANMAVDLDILIAPGSA